MTDDAMTAAIAASYFDAWNRNDFDTLRSLFADNVTFTGPLGTAANADECIEGMKHMAKIKTDIVVRKIFVDGDDVLTWFDLHTADAEPLPTANWSHVENGKITRIQATFDPRPIARSSA